MKLGADTEFRPVGAIKFVLWLTQAYRPGLSNPAPLGLKTR